MSEILAIPVVNISPFRGQPRSYFDAVALKELATSIREHGQMTPAWVVPLPSGRYQLIAGERRWRACQLAGVETLLCEVRRGLTKEQQYLASVMENFGRNGCTPMETARSVSQILKLNRGDLPKTAAAFARSVEWVRMYNRLLRLEHSVAAMLEPPDPVLDLRAGLSLSNVQPALQLQLAKQIGELGLRKRAATRFVKTATCSADRIEKRGGRARRPSDDYELMQTWLGPAAQKVMEIDMARLEAAFSDRPAGDFTNMCAALRRRANDLLRMEKDLAKLGKGAQ